VKKAGLLLTLIVGVVILLTRTIAAMAASATNPQQGAVTLAPVNGGTISASATIIDLGISLTVSGSATGLNPLQTYYSLFYDTGSVPTSPKACLPTNNSLSFAQMLVGPWATPAGGGRSVLSSVRTGPQYAPLSALGTMSVRLDTQPLSPPPTAPNPQRFVLQACGKIVPTVSPY